MHTIMVIGAGFGLLCAFLLVAKLSSRNIGGAARAFIPAWLLGALVNMWVGVSHAGYSVASEAPVFAVVFAVPAAIAYLASRSLGR